MPDDSYLQIRHRKDRAYVVNSVVCFQKIGAASAQVLVCRKIGKLAASTQLPGTPFTKHASLFQCRYFFASQLVRGGLRIRPAKRDHPVGLHEGTYMFKTTLDGFQSVVGTVVLNKSVKKSEAIRIEMPLGV